MWLIRIPLTVSLVSQLHKHIVLIPALNTLPIRLIETCPAIEHIILKLSFNPFISGENELALAVFHVMHELAFVFGPEVFEEVPVVEGELLFELFRLFVVELAVAVELLVEPFSIVGGTREIVV